MHFKRGSTSKQGDSASYSASILVEYASKMQSWRLNSLMVFLIMLVICARCCDSQWLGMSADVIRRLSQAK